MLRCYIGKIVDDVEFVPTRFMASIPDEHRFAVPLNYDSRTGPEAAHLPLPRTDGAASGNSGRSGDVVIIAMTSRYVLPRSHT